MNGEKDRGQAPVPSPEEIGGAAVAANGVEVGTSDAVDAAPATSGAEIVVADEVVDGVVVQQRYPTGAGYEGSGVMGFD